MIGSYEWAEEHAKVLSQRAVAYINVDSAMEGKMTGYDGSYDSVEILQFMLF